jgi:hypothetical protein
LRQSLNGALGPQIFTVCRNGLFATARSLYAAPTFTNDPKPVRPALLTAVLVTACLSHGAQAIEVGHTVIPDKGAAVEARPMAWDYRLLSRALEVFERRAPTLAPGASLFFALPKVDGGNTTVELVGPTGRTRLPMPTPTTFILPHDKAHSGDAQVVVNRNFEPGNVNHPNIVVRSPNLPDGVRRLGDLRLACEAQMAQAKGEGMKLRMILGALDTFLSDGICGKLAIDQLDTPASAFDRVVLSAGERREVLATTGKNDERLPKLGDRSWPDDTRIEFMREGRPAL